MSERLQQFVDKYYEIMKAAGKPLNGLTRAEIYVSLKECGAENVLEMLEVMEQYEKGCKNGKV